MAVQLHYYGSVFDLSTQYDDDHWTYKIQNHLTEARDYRDGAWLTVLLEDGRTAELLVPADGPVVVVRENRFQLNPKAFD